MGNFKSRLDIKEASMENSSHLDIIEATMHGDIESVEACLKRKEDPNKRDKLGRTPLMIASYFGSFDVVKLLIQYRAHVNPVPLDCYENEDWFKVFLEHSLFTWEIFETKSMAIKIIYVYEGIRVGWSSLLYASYQGHVDVVKLLVENGAEIDKEDTYARTALYWASKECYLEVVRFLLEKGAAVDTMDFIGLTPLIVASRKGNLNVVRSLLQNGANVEHVAKYDVTPLRVAICGGSSDVVRELIEYGANVNKKRDNDIGSTPLHDCCLFGHSEIITVLLYGGANINALNNDGKSSLDLAVEKRNWTISDILLDRGAKFGNDIQNEELREKVSNMNDRLKRFQDELKSVLTEKDEAVNEKMEEIERLKKKHDEDNDAKEVCSIALDLLIDEEDRKSDEISFLEKKLNESKEEWDLVIEEKNREFEELQSKISELTKDRQLLKVENTTFLQEVEKLKSDLEQSKADLQSANTGPLFKDCTIKVEKGSSLVVQSNA